MGDRYSDIIRAGLGGSQESPHPSDSWFGVGQQRRSSPEGLANWGWLSRYWADRWLAQGERQTDLELNQRFGFDRTSGGVKSIAASWTNFAYQSARIGTNIVSGGQWDIRPEVPDIVLNEPAGEKWNPADPTDFLLRAGRVKAQKGQDQYLREYYIAPQFTVKRRGPDGIIRPYVDWESVPIAQRHLFTQNVSSARDALQFFEQLTGEEWRQELIRQENIGLPGIFTGEIMGMLNQQEYFAEDIALFGLFNLGRRLVTVGKAGLEISRASVAVGNDAAKTIYKGAEATARVAAGEATMLATKGRLWQNVGWGSGAFRKAREAAEIPGAIGWKQQVGVGAMFAGIDQVRLRQVTAEKNLLMDKKDFGEFVAFSAAFGVVGSSLVRWQVNTMHNAAAASRNIRVLNQRFKETVRTLQRELEVPDVLDIPPDTLEAAMQRVIRDMGFEGWDEFTRPARVGLWGKFKSFMFHYADAHAEGTNNLNFKRFVYSVSDSMAQDEALGAGGSFYSAQAGYRAANGATGKTILNVVEADKGPMIPKDVELGGRPHHQASVRQIIGKIAMDDKIEKGQILEVAKDWAVSLNWNATDDQLARIAKGVTLLRNRLDETNALLMISGGVQRNFIDFNPYHVLRSWYKGMFEQDADRARKLFYEFHIRKHLDELAEEHGTPRLELSDVYPEGGVAHDAHGTPMSSMKKKLEEAAKKESEEVVSSVTGANVDSSRHFSVSGLSSVNRRMFEIADDFETDWINPKTGMRETIKTRDYYNADPLAILDNLSYRVGPKLLAASRNTEPIVKELLDTAANFYNAGNFAAAHNNMIAAQIAEILANTGQGHRLNAFKKSLAELGELSEEHQKVLGDSAAWLSINRALTPTGPTIPLRLHPNQEAYQAAESLLLDILEKKAGGGSWSARIELAQRKLRLAEERHSVEKYGKNETWTNPRTGVTNEVKTLDDIDLSLDMDSEWIQSNLSRDGAALLSEHDIVSRGARFDDVTDDLWENSRGPSSYGDSRQVPEGAVERHELLQTADEFTSTRPPVEVGPLPANEEALLKARSARGKKDKGGSTHGIGRATWDRETVVAIREAAYSLYYYLNRAQRQEFGALLKIGEDPVRLSHSGLGHVVPRAAGGTSEIFMEAVVRYVAGDTKLAGFANHVTSLPKFKKLVAKYGKGFRKKVNSRKFLDIRRGKIVAAPTPRQRGETHAVFPRRPSPTEVLENKAELAKIEVAELRNDVRNRLKEYGPYELGDLEVADYQTLIQAGTPSISGKKSINSLIRDVVATVQASGTGARRSREELNALRAAVHPRVGESIDRIISLENTRLGYENALDGLRGVETEVNDWLETALRHEYWGEKLFQQEGRFREDHLQGFMSEFDVLTVRGIYPRELKGNIVEAGRKQYDRNVKWLWDKYRIMKEHYAEYGLTQQKGGDDLIRWTNNVIDTIYGRTERGALGSTMESVNRWMQKVLYGLAAPPMTITQVNDIASAQYVLGQGEWFLTYMPQFAKAIRPFRKFHGQRLDDPFSELTDSELLEIFEASHHYAAVDGLGDNALNGDIPPNAAMDLHHGADFDPYPLLSGMPRPIQKGMDFSERMSVKSVEWTMHPIVARTRIAAQMAAELLIKRAFQHVQKEFRTAASKMLRKLGLDNPQVDKISGMSTRTKAFKNLSFEDVAKELKLSPEQRLTLDAAVQEAGSIQQVVKNLKKGLKKEASHELTRLRTLGFNDIEIEVLIPALKAVDWDWGKLPFRAKLKMRQAIVQFQNNMTPVPTATNIPQYLQTHLGQTVWAFTRFLTAVPTRHLPNAMKRGGWPAVLSAQLGTTLWALMIEGWLRPVIKGEGVWDGPSKPFSSWTNKDKGILMRVLNGNGQYGILPETISGFLAGYDRTRIPAFQAVGRMGKHVISGTKAAFEGDWGTAAKDTAWGVGGLAGFGAFETIWDYTRAHREDTPRGMYRWRK